jgi:hypothetical protein
VIAVLDLLILLCTSGGNSVELILKSWIVFASKRGQKPLEMLVGLLGSASGAELKMNLVLLANSLITFANREDLKFDIVDRLEALGFVNSCKVGNLSCISMNQLSTTIPSPWMELLKSFVGW